MVTETEIQKDIMDYLKLKGIKAWRNNSGQARYNIKLAPNGTPDIIGYLPNGKFLGIEVKKPKKKLSPDQELWHSQAILAGCVIITARSVDDVMEVI